MSVSGLPGRKQSCRSRACEMMELDVPSINLSRMVVCHKLEVSGFDECRVDERIG